MNDLRAPFPYFGGKSRAASLVWERFGTVVNYVEPFFGSGAVLLACPEQQRPRVETVNDFNAHLANVWRSITWHAEDVARACDWPVNEVDLHARHKHLLARIPETRAALDADPKWCDPELAGWWIWGASAWIGSGWCEEERPPVVQPPELGNGGNTNEPQPKYGKGVHAAGMREPSRRLPDCGGSRSSDGEPITNYGKGVHAAGMREPSRQRPSIGTRDHERGREWGRGVHGATMREPSRQLQGMGCHAPGTRTRLYDLFAALSARLRYTRVTCGDWSRICTPAVTYRHGLTAVRPCR